MTDVVRAGRGWKLWLIFILSLAAVPLNAFAILFWMWVSTHHQTETTTQDTIAAVAFCVLAAVLVADVVAMVCRSTRWVVGLSGLQLVSASLVLIIAVVGVR